MAQLSELITKVKYNIGGRTDKDAAITFALNMAVDDVANSADWPDLQISTIWTTVSIGSYYIPVDSEIRKVVGVRLKDSSGNYFEVHIIGKHLFRELVSEIIPTNTSVPYYGYYENDLIYLDCLTREQYTAYFDAYQYPTAMSATTDTPSISGIDDAIVAQATGYVFASLKQVDMASFWFSVATEKVRSKLDETRISAIGQLRPW